MKLFVSVLLCLYDCYLHCLVTLYTCNLLTKLYKYFTLAKIYLMLLVLAL